MPIRPEERGRYPSNWDAISHRIRFDRAGGRCECRGECGQDHSGEPILVRNDDGDQVAAVAFAHRPDWMPPPRCTREHGQPIPGHPDRRPVVLTTAHLDHTPENCDDDNLRAMCQACHLRYDREHHRRSRAGEG